MKLTKTITLGSLIFLSASLLSMHHENTPESVAEAWIQAMQTGKQEALDFVSKNMAEDGINAPGRYVGFGFTYNPDAEPGTMVVTGIQPDSPASKVLKIGDSFLSVNNVRVNERNMGKLNFRGKPGEEVVIERDGKRKNISVARGVISTRYTKEQVLRNINSAVAENWKPDEANIIEVTSKDNIVYVLHWAKDTDQVSGLPYEAYTITRFVFNEEGLVERIGNLSEDRFVLEQQGYTISR
jgi:hypothetical protein